MMQSFLRLQSICLFALLLSISTCAGIAPPDDGKCKLKNEKNK